MSEKTISPAPKKKLTERKGYIIYKKIRSVIFTIILLAVAAVIVVTMIARLSGNTPSFFGYSVFRVSSGSMKPEYDIGDVIVVRECDAGELKVGDVVTYKGVKDEFAGKIVTHRVVKARFEKDGQYYIQTKGDANLIEDPDVSVENILGKVEAKIGILTYIYNIFITPWGLLIMILLIIAAFFNEIVNFVKSLLGLGYREKESESVEDIIARYQSEKENEEDSKE